MPKLDQYESLINPNEFTLLKQLVTTLGDKKIRLITAHDQPYPEATLAVSLLNFGFLLGVDIGWIRLPFSGLNAQLLWLAKQTAAGAELIQPETLANIVSQSTLSQKEYLLDEADINIWVAPWPLDLNTLELTKAWIWYSLTPVHPAGHKLKELLRGLADSFDQIWFARNEDADNILKSVKVMPITWDPLWEDTEPETKATILNNLLPDLKTFQDKPMLYTQVDFHNILDSSPLQEFIKHLNKSSDFVFVIAGHGNREQIQASPVWSWLWDQPSSLRPIIIPFGRNQLDALIQQSTLVFRVHSDKCCGQSLLEAMWHGKPVASIKDNISSNLVINGYTGVCISDLQTLAEETLQLIKDKRIQKLYGNNARQEISSTHLISSVYIKILTTLNQISATSNDIHLHPGTQS